MIATETSPKPSATAEAPPQGKPLTLRVTDVTGQKKMKIRVASGDIETTIGELVDSLLPRMGLPGVADGRPLSYSARLEREGRHLQGSERVAEALREDDELLLSPSINAG
jgi:hypothetical protein